MTDYRLPENRREGFMRQYLLHLEYKTHPGCVYFLLPALAEEFAGDDLDRRAWIVWLNGNTQNPVATQLLLEASDGNPKSWRKAVDYWNENFKLLEWDTDRRHQKPKFGEATEKYMAQLGDMAMSEQFECRGAWSGLWDFAVGLPYMGRLSAWSMSEYARILLGDGIPAPDSLLLGDKSGSRSHRNGISLLAGAPAGAEHWTWDEWEMLSPCTIEELEVLGQDLLLEAAERAPLDVLEDVNRYTLESALCTWKSWWKPNRRYPGVYADMHYLRVKKAEKRLSRTFPLQWSAREASLPAWLRQELQGPLEGLDKDKQNRFRLTGVPANHEQMKEMGL